MGENNTKTNKAFNHNLNKWVNVDRWAATHNTIINKCVTNNVEYRCLCCKVLKCDTVFSSNVTGKQFIFSKDGNFSCKSCNLIYLISGSVPIFPITIILLKPTISTSSTIQSCSSIFQGK